LLDIPSLLVSIPSTAEAYIPILFEVENSTFTDFSWNFGDGGVSLDQIVEHTYTSPGTYEVELLLSDNTEVDCTLQFVETIEVIGNVGIDEFADSDLCIFPNPSSLGGQVKIEGLTGDGSLTIYNEQGQIIKRDRLGATSTHQLDTTSLSSGIYILRLHTYDGKDLTSKLLIY